MFPRFIKLLRTIFSSWQVISDREKGGSSSLLTRSKQNEIHTPIGFLWLDADESGLTAVSFQPISESESANQQILTRTQEQFEEYFAGKRKEFEVPLSIKRGTPFQQNVWKALSTIPYGEIRTYKEVAVAVDSPKAVRAIGQANRTNPLPIVIPCHRVIGQNGKLTGYMGNATDGVEIKRQLLLLKGYLQN